MSLRASLSVSPPGAIHSVHFYTQDEALVQRLCGIFAAAINVGNSVLIVATEAHGRQITSRLENEGLDPASLRESGRFILKDASEVLKKFMVRGLPDRERFEETIGPLLERARSAAWNRERGVTAFGEMVAVLLEAGNHKGALQLEALWNDLLSDHSFHLHCAYPQNVLSQHADESVRRAICVQHSHVVGQTA